MPLARTGESDEPSTRRRGGRLLLVAGLILVLGAAGVLVLSDDLRFLRLGIMAGLWAALVGAFIAARYRGQVADREDRAADLQAVYELELEREIAARREYELQVEAEIRAEVDEQSRRDVAALRDELRTLRQTLENLLGGEVLVERYALQAQATRMRPLQEAQVKRLPAAVNGPPPEPVTEQFDRVTELRPVKTGPRAVPPLPRRADRPERPPWPTPTAAKPSPVDAPNPRVAELPPTVVAQFRPSAAEQPPPPRNPAPPPQAERSQSRTDRPPEQSLPRMNPVPPPQAERSRSRLDRSQSPEQSLPRMNPVPPPRADRSPSRMDRSQSPERSQSRMSPVPPPQAERSRSRLDRPQPPPEQSLSRMNPVLPPQSDRSMSRMDRPQRPEQSQSRMNPVGPAWADRSLPPGPRTPEPWEVGPDGRAQPGPRMQPAAPEQSLSRMNPVPPPGPRAEDSVSRMSPAHPEFRPAPGADSLSRLSPAQPEPWEVEQPGRRGVERQRAAEPVRTAWDERPVAPPPHPAEMSDRWFVPGALQQEPSGRHSGNTGGRPRRAEEPEPPRRHARPDEEAGGRRRRAEETPSWQELATWDPVVKATSRGWAPDSGSHSRADEGSHASGHSVADLLAQHGAESPRRRRRRED